MMVIPPPPFLDGLGCLSVTATPSIKGTPSRVDMRRSIHPQTSVAYGFCFLVT